MGCCFLLNVQSCMFVTPLVSVQKGRPFTSTRFARVVRSHAQRCAKMYPHCAKTEMRRDAQIQHVAFSNLSEKPSVVQGRPARTMPADHRDPSPSFCMATGKK